MKVKYQLEAGFIVVTKWETGNHCKPRYKLIYGHSSNNFHHLTALRPFLLHADKDDGETENK